MRNLSWMITFGTLLLAAAPGCTGCGQSTESATDNGSSNATDASSDGSAGAADGGQGRRDGGAGNQDDSGKPDVVLEVGPPIPWNTLPQKCADAAEKGVVWLASMQKPDGSWGTPSADTSPYCSGATGFAVIKLQTYAVEHGISPFDPTFKYNKHVLLGLKHLFKSVKLVDMTGSNDTNNNGKGATFELKAGQSSSTDFSYLGAIMLMAITAGQGHDQIVDSPGSAVHGMSFKTLAQDFVDYFSECQADNGGWRYQCKQAADNSVSQYVALALEYASHPDYKFNCTIPPKVYTELTKWVSTIQNTTTGGSGYTAVGDSNPYRTGALLQELAFVGVGKGDPRYEKALTYIDTNFEASFSGTYQTTAYYMEMWAVMKGLVTQGITLVGARDWYQEYCDVIVSQQNPDGSWPLSFRDRAETETVMSTAWALLVLEKAAPPPRPK